MIDLYPILWHILQHVRRRTFPILDGLVPSNPHQAFALHDTFAWRAIVIANEPRRWTLRVSKNLLPSVSYRFFRRGARMTVNDVGVTAVESNTAMSLNDSAHFQVPLAIVILVVSIERRTKTDASITVDPRYSFEDDINARRGQSLPLAPERKCDRLEARRRCHERLHRSSAAAVPPEAARCP